MLTSLNHHGRPSPVQPPSVPSDIDDDDDDNIFRSPRQPFDEHGNTMYECYYASSP